MGKTTIKRLYWGCGSWRPAGWINADQKDGPGIDISCDIRDGLPLDTGSIDYAVSIHALPEVPYPNLVPVLKELRRVLKPNGFLRLGLPDLDRTIQAYLQEKSSYFLIPDEEAKCLGAKFVIHLIWYGYTRTFFTHDFIEEQLLKACFRSVDRCAYGETRSPYPRIVELDNRQEESFLLRQSNSAGCSVTYPAGERAPLDREGIAAEVILKPSPVSRIIRHAGRSSIHSRLPDQRGRQPVVL